MWLHHHAGAAEVAIVAKHGATVGHHHLTLPCKQAGHGGGRWVALFILIIAAGPVRGDEIRRGKIACGGHHCGGAANVATLHEHITEGVVRDGPAVAGVIFFPARVGSQGDHKILAVTTSRLRSRMP